MFLSALPFFLLPSLLLDLTMANVGPEIDSSNKAREMGDGTKAIMI